MIGMTVLGFFAGGCLGLAITRELHRYMKARWPWWDGYARGD